MTQPTTQVLLDSANPFYGWLYYAQGNGMWDARTGATLTKVGTGDVVVDNGVNVVTSGGAANPTMYTLPAQVNLSVAFTVIVRARLNASGTKFLGMTNDMDYIGDVNAQLKYVQGNYSAYSTGLTLINAPRTFAYRVADDKFDVFIDGVLATSRPTEVLTYDHKLAINCLMAGSYGSATLDGSVEYIMALPFGATDAEIASLHAEPYQALIGFKPTVYVPDVTLVGGGLLYASGADNGSVTALVAANEISISLPSGTQTNYPYQFGRPFRKGEIVTSPQVLLDGVALTTQADIKTRHKDGSVKFSVISVILPTISTTNRVITFQNQTAPVATPVSIASMLADYDFEATIDVKQLGASLVGAPVSARAMLATLTDSQLLDTTNANGVNSRFWTVGPICTTLILCDHTTKAWDFGSDVKKSIRPVFHVQFWPEINQYKVRPIVEVSDVTKLKHELDCNIIFSTGFAAPVERLNNTYTLWMCTWQSREYWKGAGLPRLNAKYGVAYLSECGVVANHDPSIVMNAAAITSYETEWATRTKTLGSAGFWQKGMDSTGGRQDLGLMPKWDNVCLYSGDARMYQVCDESAELAGSWSMFIREGLSTKTVDGVSSGIGKIISKLSRPTIMFPQMKYGANGDVTDRLSIDYSGVANTDIQDGWLADDAHTPGVFWLQYITSGAYFWHEKLIQMAAMSQFSVNPAAQYGANGRANTDCILWNQQTRATGWQYRNRSRAWWAMIDGTPEKRLADRWLEDPTAMLCGLEGVDSFVGHPIREGWNDNYNYVLAGRVTTPRPNALHYFGGGSPDDRANDTYGSWPPDSLPTGFSPWMTDYLIMGISTAIELGYTDAQPLRDWLTELKIRIALSGQPRHMADYVFPYIKSDGTFFQSLEDIFDQWPGGTPSPGIPQSMDMSLDGTQHYLIAGGTVNTWNVTMPGYGSVAIAAIAMCNGRAQQAEAWAVVEPWHVVGATAGVSYYDHDPTWAIIPRVMAGTVISTITANGTVLMGTGTIYPGTVTVGAGASKTVSVSLVNPSNAALGSLTGLKWAWFDQLTPDAFNAPTDQGSGEVTDGSGVLTVSIPNSTKTSGQAGWLIITDSDGSTVMAHKAFSGPVAVS